jgi:uncharacterized protein HemY
MKLQWLQFISIILAALLAGTSFGIWLGFNPSRFSPGTYIEQQQNLVRSLNTLMLILVTATAVIILISAFIQRKNKTVFLILLLAAALFISCMAITRLGNVPIQSEMLKWTIHTMPANWTELRDKWWLLHTSRTFVEILGLLLITWTTVQKKT